MKGILRKMEFSNLGNEFHVIPHYTITLSSEGVNLSQLIGKTIEIKYLNAIHCIKCGRKTPKSFGQGYCYPCFMSAPETEECVLRPELCRAHEGVARNMDFARDNCLIKHYVYLAWTGGLKVGVTRSHQIPTRWVDQGATMAVKLCRTPNRYTAGLVEVELKKILSDKTAWQRMLTDTEGNPRAILTEKAKSLEYINGKGFTYIPETDELYRIDYQVLQYPQKVKSTTLDRVNRVEGILIGIKGQYLIFGSGEVFNVRNHSGYLVELNF